VDEPVFRGITVMTSVMNIRWFREIGVSDIALVGGKNSSLGEMYRELTPRGVRIPNGFEITAPLPPLPGSQRIDVEVS
jgi:hypothetical protein